VRDKEAQVKEKDQFHKNEIANNREMEGKIAKTERMYTRLQQEYQNADRLQDAFNSEVSIVVFFSFDASLNSVSSCSQSPTLRVAVPLCSSHP